MKLIKTIKLFLMIAFIATTAYAMPQQVQADLQKKRHTAVVVESLDAGNYTYMQVNEKGNIFWIAAKKVKVNKGDIVGFNEQMWHEQFVSDSLSRTFEKLLFVSGVKTVTATSAPKRNPSRITPSTPSNTSDYPLEEAQTVAELYTNAQKFNGKTVKVRGKVIKVMENIMGMNWIHLQDGTSTAEYNKMVFTSKTESPDVGAVVTAKGTLAADKDFGYNYFYKAIVENSTFSK